MEFKKWLEIASAPGPLGIAKQGVLTPTGQPMMQDPLVRGYDALTRGVIDQLKPKKGSGPAGRPWKPPRKIGKGKGLYQSTQQGKPQVMIIGLAPLKDEADSMMNPYDQAKVAWRDAHKRIADTHSLETTLAVRRAREQAFANPPEIDYEWQKAIQIDPDFANIDAEMRKTHVPVIFRINQEVMSQ